MNIRILVQSKTIEEFKKGIKNMESAISIGAKVDKESCDNLSQFIIDIFESASKNRMSDDVTAIALELYKDVFSIEGVSISNCEFIISNDDMTMKKDANKYAKNRIKRKSK